MQVCALIRFYSHVSRAVAMATKKQGSLLLTSLPVNYCHDALHPKKQKHYNHVPMSMRGNQNFTHPDLTKGQKKYLWSICSIYSTAQMKWLIQDQFLQQLFDEMRKGIIKTDWMKYIEYISDPSKRKQQFQSLSARQWKAPPDQYQFRYYRDHPLDLPTPPMPSFVQDAIDTRRRASQPKQRRIFYIPRHRRRFAGATSTPGPSGKKSAPFVNPQPPESPKTSLGFARNKPSNGFSSPEEIPSYSSNFTSSSNGGSDQNMLASRVQGEGLTRPKSRISSAQRNKLKVL